jgi:hypothetical protein
MQGEQDGNVAQGGVYVGTDDELLADNQPLSIHLIAGLRFDMLEDQEWLKPMRPTRMFIARPGFCRFSYG